ncbi:hypothetical protein Tco_0863648 [Tanacetum coccineum]
MPTEVTEEEDIEETTTVGVPKIGKAYNQEMKTEIHNFERTFLPFLQHSIQSSMIEKGQKNHQASIQDLETKFGRLSDQCSSRQTSSFPSNTQTNSITSPTNDKPYRPPSAWNEHVNDVFTRSGLTYNSLVNPNANTIVIHDDSEDEVYEAEKELESSSSKQTESDPPPLKAYKQKIPYPHCLRKEKMEERYAKFIDLI